MSAVLTIAKATVREASRKRLVLALAAITVIGIIVTGFGFWRLNAIAHEVVHGRLRMGPSEKKLVISQLLIFVMFAFSFVLAISTVFMAAPTIAGELESGVALAVLTRPVRRLEVLAGKWLGLGALATVYVSIASVCEFVVVDLTTGYHPPHPVQFIVFLTAETLAALTLTTFISTRLSPVAGGVVALGGFMLAWMGGIALAIGQVLNNHGIQEAGALTRLIMPSDGLWRGAVYALEPVSVIAGVLASDRTQAAANPFFASASPAIPYLVWAGLWAVLVFAAAAWSFRRREV